MTGTQTVPPDDGEDGDAVVEEVIESFEADRATWMTEPSGVLNVYRGPNQVWSSYAPGSWKAVRFAPTTD
ncbi:hypothetical protein [Williamsia deligens]|uniref:Uncharacterized protein n=1 Tax=Williamsia deligens TaxID=321325 RepID=A0ABW3GD60_9NOCA|nr:hypothetical protein [Williamsia deligens]